MVFGHPLGPHGAAPTVVLLLSHPPTKNGSARGHYSMVVSTACAAAYRASQSSASAKALAREAEHTGLIAEPSVEMVTRGHTHCAEGVVGGASLPSPVPVPAVPPSMGGGTPCSPTDIVAGMYVVLRKPYLDYPVCRITCLMHVRLSRSCHPCATRFGHPLTDSRSHSLP